MLSRLAGLWRRAAGSADQQPEELSFDNDLQLTAFVRRVRWSSSGINEAPRRSLELQFAYDAEVLIASAEVLRGDDGRNLEMGDPVELAFDPAGSTATVAVGGEVVLARVAPPKRRTRFARVDGVELTKHHYGTARVISLALSLTNGDALRVPALETAIAPFEDSEVLELELPGGDPALARIVSRSTGYAQEPVSIAGDERTFLATVIGVRDPGIRVLEEQLVEVGLEVCRDSGTAALTQLMFAADTEQVEVGDQLPIRMVPSLLDRRTRLQSGEARDAIVTEIDYLDRCYGAAPYCSITFAADENDQVFTAEETQDLARLPLRGQRVAINADPASGQATIADPAGRPAAGRPATQPAESPAYDLLGFPDLA